MKNDEITQLIKEQIRKGKYYKCMTYTQRQALDAMAHQISELVEDGIYDIEDSWELLKEFVINGQEESSK